MMYHFQNEKTDEPSVFSILKIVYKKSNCYRDRTAPMLNVTELLDKADIAEEQQ